MLCCVLCFGSLAQGELWKCSFCVGHLLALQALFLLRLRLPFFAETSLGVSLPGSSSSSSSLPLGGQGKRGGGSRGAPSVFMRCFLPSRSTLVRRECLWAFVCCVRARSFFSSSFGRWGRGSWLSCCRLPFPASPSLLTPQFSPHVPRRENSRESSVSCSRVLSSRESRSSERG